MYPTVKTVVARIHSVYSVPQAPPECRLCMRQFMYFSSVLVTGRLVNRSGLRLSYWTDDASEDGEVGCAYTLNAWEESPLLVDPVERTVIIPDTQQQATFFLAACIHLLYAVATHICMRQ